MIQKMYLKKLRIKKTIIPYTQYGMIKTKINYMLDKHVKNFVEEFIHIKERLKINNLFVKCINIFKTNQIE